MVQVLSLTVFALLLARVVHAPRGTWRWIIAAAAIVLLLSQLLPAGNAFRQDVAGSIVPLIGLCIVLLPVVGYGLLIRRIRSRTLAPEAALARSRPVGPVLVPEDAAFTRDTEAALAAELDAEADLAVGTDPGVEMGTGAGTGTGRSVGLGAGAGLGVEAGKGAAPGSGGRRAAAEHLSVGWRDPAGEMVGHARLRLASGVAELELLWVARPARRQGIGAGLIAQAALEARLRGARALLATAPTSRTAGYLARHGFRPYGAFDPGSPGGRIHLAMPLR